MGSEYDMYEYFLPPNWREKNYIPKTLVEQAMTSYQLSLNNSYNHLFFANQDVRD